MELTTSQENAMRFVDKNTIVRKWRYSNRVIGIRFQDGSKLYLNSWGDWYDRVENGVFWQDNTPYAFKN